MNLLCARSVLAPFHRLFLVVGFLLTNLQCSRDHRNTDIPISQQESRPVEAWVREAKFARIEIPTEADGKVFLRLQQRLDDLQEAGFTVVWLSSIFPSSSLSQQPESSDPFPTQDYRSVNEDFGTLEEFKHLVREISRRGLRIVIDLQARYTAWDSKLVMEHPDWFRTNDEGAIVSPTPELSDVAALNYRHHELRKYMIEALKYWVREVGVDGFACLDADHVPLEFWIRARKEIEKVKPVFLIGQSDRGELHREAFDATFSSAVSDFLDPAAGAASIGQMLRSEAEQFPRNALRLRFNRPLSTFPHKTNSPRDASREKLREALAYTLPGNPVIVFSDGLLLNRWLPGRNVLQFHSTLSRLRSEYAAVTKGEWKDMTLTEAGDFIAYERRVPGESILVLLNNSSKRQSLSIQLPPQFSGIVLDFIAGNHLPTTTGYLNLQCRPYEVKVIIRSSKGTSS